MKNTNSLGGMPVVCEGVRIGRVLSVQLTPELNGMAGLHVDCGLKGRRYIPRSRVKMLGDLAVLVERGFARPEGPSPLPRRALAPDGAHLGCITGAWIDETSHGVDSLELSGGVFQDLVSGRIRVRFYHVQKDKGDVVVETDASSAQTGGGEP